MAETNRKLFNGQFTVGNLITILVIIFGLAAGWGAFSKEIEHNTKSIRVATEEIDLHTKDPRVHYMVGSPMATELKCLNNKLENLTEEVIKLRIAVEKSGG